jgi:hypothetical protein
VIEKTGETGINFPDHLAGTSLVSIIGEVSSNTANRHNQKFL